MTNENPALYTVTGPIDRIPPYDPTHQHHYWTVAVAFRVDPTIYDPHNADLILDHENLILVPRIAVCFYCEQPYSRYIYHRRCPGVPQ